MIFAMPIFQVSHFSDNNFGLVFNPQCTLCKKMSDNVSPERTAEDTCSK